jgi:hypothetical protein
MDVRFGKAAPISDRWKTDAGIVLVPRTQIMPCQKMRAVAGENDDLDGIVLDRPVEGGVEVVGHLQILGVARLGPVHHDPRDTRLRPLHNNGFESIFACTHGSSGTWLNHDD